MKAFFNIGVLTAGLLVLFSTSAFGTEKELAVYRGAVLAENRINDGDSFIVKAGDEVFHVRLYFVDCPETIVYADHDARRVQEQARYFGIDTAERVMWLGEQAAQFTKAVLSDPFTLYTYKQAALGGPNSKRIYGFVVTANGQDLGELLVENGFGRNFGVKSRRYDGATIDETLLRLRDLEVSAMLGHRGIWSESNASRIAQYRQDQRDENSAIRAIMKSNIVLLESPIDINTASRFDLERVPGIGPVTASRIIENRPYGTIEDLMTVRGIGSKTFEKLRPFIRIAPGGATNG